MSYAQPSPPDDPHALADEGAGERARAGAPTRPSRIDGGPDEPASVGEPLIELGDALALGRDRRVVGGLAWIDGEDRRREVGADGRAELARAAVGPSSIWCSSAMRMPSPNSALSSNSEFAHAGPRPAALVLHGVVGRLPP